MPGFEMRGVPSASERPPTEEESIEPELVKEVREITARYWTERDKFIEFNQERFEEAVAKFESIDSPQREDYLDVLRMANAIGLADYVPSVFLK